MLTNKMLLMFVSLLTCFLLSPVVTANPSSKVITLHKAPFANEPVQITDIHYKSGQIALDKSFTANHDWLDGLSITVINISGKPIYALELAIDVLINGNSDTEEIVRLPIRYGNAQELNEKIPANSKITMLITNQMYSRFVQLLSSNNINISEVSRLHLSIRSAQFDENTRWRVGKVFNRSKSDPTKWLPVKDKTARASEIKSTVAAKYCGKALDHSSDRDCCVSKACTKNVIEEYVSTIFLGEFRQMVVQEECGECGETIVNVCRYYDVMNCSYLIKNSNPIMRNNKVYTAKRAIPGRESNDSPVTW